MYTEGYTVFSGGLKHAPKGHQAVKKAEQSGHNVEYYKKSQHSNKNSLDGRYVAKIMNSEQDHLPPQMPHELRIAIAQARNAKGWNQQQFAKTIQIPKPDVNAWQAGKSVPSNAIIAKMQKILGVKLPRPSKN